jgi:hypothetical protein
MYYLTIRKHIAIMGTLSDIDIIANSMIDILGEERCKVIMDYSVESGRRRYHTSFYMNPA